MKRMFRWDADVASAQPNSVDTRPYHWLAIGSIGLGVGLFANSLLGPLVADVVRYPFSESIRNQTIGLEAVSLIVVAPLCILAGVLGMRGRNSAPVVAFGPAAYTAYMFVQYVIGPQYTYYAGIVPLHLALFMLGLGVAVAAWSLIKVDSLPRMKRRSERRYAVLLLALAAFIVSRYAPNMAAAIVGDPVARDFRQNVSMYWSIVLLDLGVVVPATIAGAVGILRHAQWSHKALLAVLGWFALVPPSVAAMSIVMVMKNDPNAGLAQAIVLSIAAVVFGAVAIRLYVPVLWIQRSSTNGALPGRADVLRMPRAPATEGR